MPTTILATRVFYLPCAECEAGTASHEDIDIALENPIEIHDYLVDDRRPP
jgi:hypothetical protein